MILLIDNVRDMLSKILCLSFSMTVRQIPEHQIEAPISISLWLNFDDILILPLLRLIDNISPTSVIIPVNKILILSKAKDL